MLGAGHFISVPWAGDRALVRGFLGLRTDRGMMVLEGHNPMVTVTLEQLQA